MKQIENRSTSILEAEGKSETISFADIMLSVMNGKQPEGYPPSKMRKDFRVIDLLDKVIAEKQASFSMEDADFDWWWSKYGSDFAFGMRHKDLLAFDDYIKAVKEGKEIPNEAGQSATE